MDHEPRQPYRRFLVFGYDNYYTVGGESDVLDSFDTLEEAIDRMKLKDCDFYDVLDLDERRFRDKTPNVALSGQRRG